MDNPTKTDKDIRGWLDLNISPASIKIQLLRYNYKIANYLYLQIPKKMEKYQKIFVKFPTSHNFIQKIRVRGIIRSKGPTFFGRIKEVFELQKFELQNVFYKSFVGKIDGDSRFVRTREIFELEGFELERVYCM